MLEALPYDRAERLDGVNGLGNALQAIATLLLMCDARDLGVAVGEKDELEMQKADGRMQNEPGGMRRSEEESGRVVFEPNIYLYDKYPGGIGFSEPLFRMSDTLIENTHKLIAGCACPSGCPSCVGPVGEIGEKGKEVALAILKQLTVDSEQ
jgi:DEAD/DEAH box helicase domain-containing protein